MTDISIVLVARGRTPGERTILAGGIKANEDLEFTIRVDLADDLPTGRYVIRGTSVTIGSCRPPQPFTVGR